MNNPLAAPKGTESEYRKHIRALEHAAAQLDRGDLDPEQALEVYRAALRRYEAALAILNAVAEEFRRFDGQSEEANIAR